MNKQDYIEVAKTGGKYKHYKVEKLCFSDAGIKDGDVAVKVSDTKNGSHKFGPCELCSSHAPTIFICKAERAYTHNYLENIRMKTVGKTLFVCFDCADDKRKKSGTVDYSVVENHRKEFYSNPDNKREQTD